MPEVTVIQFFRVRTIGKETEKELSSPVSCADCIIFLIGAVWIQTVLFPIFLIARSQNLQIEGPMQMFKYGQIMVIFINFFFSVSGIIFRAETHTGISPNSFIIFEIALDK